MVRRPHPEPSDAAVGRAAGSTVHTPDAPARWTTAFPGQETLEYRPTPICEPQAFCHSPLVNRRRVPLFWQIFVPNALLLALAGVALTVSPATISSPPLLVEVVVVAIGIALMVIVNLVLLRRSVAPLEELARLMRDVDPLRPGQRVTVGRASAEIDQLAEMFNRMLERLEAERRDSGRRMLAAQETERHRLARELHDQIGQTLTALMLEVGHAAERAPEVRSELREAQEAARALSDDVREIVRQLRPEALDDLGLTSALTVLGEQFSQRSGIELRRRFSSELPALDPEAEVVLYRVAQESLTNVARHADASRVELGLVPVDDGVRLEICDNGHGLNGAMPGNGIRGMRERALLVGGRLTLESPQAGGVRVRLDIPSAKAPL
jgi:two-component system, NarL family, sensor histidine kinase UhpB